MESQAVFQAKTQDQILLLNRPPSDLLSFNPSSSKTANNNNNSNSTSTTTANSKHKLYNPVVAPDFL